MKRIIAVIITAALLLCGCNLKEQNIEETADAAVNSNAVFPYTFEDALGNSVTVESAARVVILYGSFAEAWLNAGGKIAGTTQDAVEERGLELSADVKIVGTVKEPNLEEIIGLEPTLVILSADIEKQANIGNSLRSMNIPCSYMRIDLFDDYLNFLRIACDMTGRDDLYKLNGTDIGDKIYAVIERIPDNSEKTVLLLRAFSTGAKAKNDDNFTGVMLKELGCTNIADNHPSLLEDLSIEEIIAEDPDYIFVTTMGDEKKAMEALENGICSNPAWSELSAVKNGRFIVLPKELFHYKPNSRWSESYDYLAGILHPEIFN